MKINSGKGVRNWRFTFVRLCPLQLNRLYLLKGRLHRSNQVHPLPLRLLRTIRAQQLQLPQRHVQNRLPTHQLPLRNLRLCIPDRLLLRIQHQMHLLHLRWVPHRRHPLWKLIMLIDLENQPIKEINTITTNTHHHYKDKSLFSCNWVTYFEKSEMHCSK